MTYHDSGRVLYGTVRSGVLGSCPVFLGKLRSIFNHIRGLVWLCSVAWNSVLLSWLRHGQARFAPALRGKVRNYSLSRHGSARLSLAGFTSAWLGPLWSCRVRRCCVSLGEVWKHV